MALCLLPLASILPAGINIGVRHAMAVYVSLSVAAGWALIHTARWITFPFAVWLVVASALAHPDDLASFNQAARPDPAWFLADSDLDWGQYLPSPVQLMDRRGIATSRVAYFPASISGAVYDRAG